MSDNDATNVVLSFVGLDRVNALAEELGLPATRMRRRMMDAEARESGRDNTTSPRDMVDLLAELAQGPRLSAAVREPILASLEKTEHLGGVARYLPADAVYAGKLRRRHARRSLRARLQPRASRRCDRSRWPS